MRCFALAKSLSSGHVREQMIAGRQFRVVLIPNATSNINRTLLTDWVAVGRAYLPSN